VNSGSIAIGAGCPDADGDGVTDAEDNCPAWPNSGQAWPPWPVPADDSDCDGFSATVEAHVGTAAAQHCAPTSAQNDDPLPDAWAVDFDDSQKATTQDVLKYIPLLNKKSTDAGYDVRFDINNSNSINTQDVIKFIPFLNRACSP
jgi:hypothetical protein